MELDGRTSLSVVLWQGSTRYQKLSGELARLRTYTWGNA
jgi:hypothetical protein